MEKMKSRCRRCRSGFEKPFGSPQELCTQCGGQTKSCSKHGWYTIAPGVLNDNCRRCSPMITHRPKQGLAKNPTNIGDPLSGFKKKVAK